MRGKWGIIITRLFITMLFIAGCSNGAAKPERAQATTIPPVPSDAAIVVDGILLPVRHVVLTASTGGQVVEVNVHPGQSVAPGDVLIRLDDSLQRAALAEAQARLERARAYLDKLEAGPREEDIAVAQAGVEKARAQMANAQRGPSPAQIAAAQADVAEAKAALEKITRGPNPYELAAAQAELDNARVELSLAQAAYDRIKSLPGASARPEAIQLQRATSAYRVAEAHLKALQQGASEAEIAAAKANLDAAQARLDALRSLPTPEDLAVAKAQLREAEARLAQAKAPARPEDIRAAKADVSLAQAAVEQAQIALERTRIRAPFAGAVGDVRVEVGAYVTPGTPLARVGDIAAWQVQTTNLSQLDVVHIHVGDPVTLTFDALPDLEMRGRVAAIDPVGKNSSGDILYTVYIDVDGQDDRLYWGMTVAVHFGGQK